MRSQVAPAASSPTRLSSAVPHVLDEDAQKAAVVPLRWLTAMLCFLSGFTAVGGGIVLLVWRGETPFLPPLEVLEFTPFETYSVPGLLLAGLVGGTSLWATLAVWRSSRLAGDLTLLAGGALSVWIIAEVAVIREVAWLHGVYAALGLVILTLGVNAALAGKAATLEDAARQRWTVQVTFAKALGFMVPVLCGLSLSQLELGGFLFFVIMVGAGMVEGLLLGAGQALAFPLPVDRRRFAGLTAAAAGLIWATLLLVWWGVQSESAFPAAQALSGLVAAVVGLTAVGVAQWVELRRHTALAPRWIAVTALAWLVALPASFAVSLFVDETTPFAHQVTLLACGGLLMAYLMALITWQGVRRLPAAAAALQRPRRGT